ncbi:hypothetical protein LSAT2_025864 [Lamellibrachia satsuma]|nr:hypothetical protein LSAT2_025864 [Lamellibrachia satsuma]
MVAWFVLISAVAAVIATEDPKTVRVTSILVDPYLDVNGSLGPDTGSMVYYGMIDDILDEMERISDLRFQLSIVPDNKYGTFCNGTWSGLIGQLIDDKADIAAAPLAVSLLRERHVDFSVPFQSSEAMIVLNKRRPWYLPTINGLDDLANQNSLQYGTLKTGGLWNQMKWSKDQDIRRLVQTMNDNPAWMKGSNTDGVYAVRRNVNYAFIMEGSAARYIAGRPPCDLDLVPTDLSHRQYAFAVRNMSPLRDVINEALVTLRENGELARLEEKWYENVCGGAANVGGAAGAVALLVALTVAQTVALTVAML